MRNIDNHNHGRQFLEEQQLRWTCTMGISGACVDSKLRSIKATCIVSSTWQGTILVLRAIKNLSLANEHAYCDFVRMYLQTHSMMELNQTLTKSMPRFRKRFPRGVNMREKFGVKEGGRCLLKRGVLSRVYSIWFLLYTSYMFAFHSSPLKSTTEAYTVTGNRKH